MNKRTRELMVELKKTVSTHRGAAVLIGYDEIEKFAELVVRECADVAFDDWCEGTNEESSQMAILKHFGVEE